MQFVTCVCASALSALFANSAQAQPAPTVTFSASPTSIPNSQSSTLAWTSANATACSGTGKGFSPSGPSGSIAVSPKTTTTYGITCTGAGGSASQSATVAVTPAPTLTVGETVAAIGTVYVDSTPASKPAIGSEWPGNQGVVIAGPVSNGTTWWEVAFNDGLTGWVGQSAVAAVSPTAPPVSFSANPASIPPWASSTLSWSSTNATSCSGVGFSPSGVSGSLSVLPTATTVYSITCTGSGGSTTQSAEVVVNPYPTIGMTVAANGTVYVELNSSKSARDRLRVARQPGRGHRRSHEQGGHMVAGRLQRRPYRVGFSGRSRARIAKGADSLVQRKSCEHPALGLVDAFMVVDQRDFLQWSRLLSIGRLRVSLSFADCNHRLQHHLHRQWRIDNSISRGGREPISHDWHDGRG